MKYVDEFRDGEAAKGLTRALQAAALPHREYHLMEFCGGHTHSLCRYGLLDLLPPNVKMVHGPGCPVCVLPIGRLAQAIRLAFRPGVTLCTYGDLMRVPGKDRLSLLQAKAQGAHVKMVFSSQDALAYARAHPNEEVVFFAIGFETTTPTTCAAVQQAKALGVKNLSFLINHVLTPSAIDAILGSSEARRGQIRVDGFIGPGHVSTIIGLEPYRRFARDAKTPIVIAGFEPLDLLQAMTMLLQQLNDGRAEVENQYTRAVQSEGNRKAQALVEATLELRDEFAWRGLGTLPKSALKLRPELREFDAELRFDLADEHVPDHKACACGDILKGLKRPTDCPIFGTACTPDSPMGSCMVSPEGSCAAYWQYGRHRQEQRRSA